ncbi:MAG: GTP-binding protein [Candidatus Lokiarchaeota archaeon]|nr:GTP-binding protein [Candidatus Lokiarchaeota archaeon]
MSLEKKKYMFKIIVVGDNGVGKTSLVRRYTEDKFDETTKHTISDNYFKAHITFFSGSSAEIQLWDFGGQAKHGHLLNNFVAGARGALLLIDMTLKLKIINVLEWVNMVRMHDMSLPIVLVGTKSDLKESILVDKEEIQHIKEMFRFTDYIETSAKLSVNVFKVFYSLVKYLIETKK